MWEGWHKMYWDLGYYNKDKHLNHDNQNVTVTHSVFFLFVLWKSIGVIKSIRVFSYSCKSRIFKKRILLKARILSTRIFSRKKTRTLPHDSKWQKNTEHLLLPMFIIFWKSRVYHVAHISKETCKIDFWDRRFAHYITLNP